MVKVLVALAVVAGLAFALPHLFPSRAEAPTMDTEKGSHPHRRWLQVRHPAPPPRTHDCTPMAPATPAVPAAPTAPAAPPRLGVVEVLLV